MDYIEILCNKLEEKDKCFSTKDDYENIRKYNEEKNESYQFHLEVLPQPYFCNINNPKVLFLAKKPSYEDGTQEEYKDNNDILDTIKFAEDKCSLIDYIKNL